VKEFCSPVLKTGIILAIFNLFGNIPVDKETFIIFASGSASRSKDRFITYIEILS
jgi:hypothetical protein